MGSQEVDSEIEQARAALAGREPGEVLAWAAEHYAPRIALATAFGPEGCVLIDLVARQRLPIPILTLETGLLFPETQALTQRLEQRYGLSIGRVHPAQSVEQQARAHGDRLWERDPERCCALRKVEPLQDALRGLSAWVTGIRRDQTRERATVQTVERDARFGIVKLNPLAAWSEADVWDYVRRHEVPVNALHGSGYRSIGCVPCTTPVAPGEAARAGRWRGQGRSECGLHVVSQGPSFRLQRKEENGMSRIVEPHGGELIDRIVAPDEEQALRARAPQLPRIDLDAREAADLELIATGAASPLDGFLGSADYTSVLERMRLANGTVWPLPLTLAVGDETRARLEPRREVALYAAGRLAGTLAVSELFARDPLLEARKLLGTEDTAHPGVAYLVTRPRVLVAGRLSALPLPADIPFARHRLTPRQLRQQIAERGWRHVAGFQTRNPIHRAHEHLTKLALEQADGLVIHPLVGETKGDDVPADVRFRCYEVLLEKYYPKERTLLAAFPAAMRYAGPREALFHALLRKNYGIDRLIVGRDHAGVGTFYGPHDAQRIFDRFTFEELGVSPLRLEPTFFCKSCDALASPRTCPHDASARLELSGTRVRELLREGARLPAEFTRPEVAEILRAHYAAAPSRPPAHRRGGLIVWFTGLSGAGKSTLARALEPWLASQLSVEVLDGDEVRTHFSKGLGFSREDRDTNVRRIGFVARLLARHGVGVIAAAISPYAATRAEVRQAAQREGVPFLEVFAEAGIESLIARDVKGLYRKALDGELPHFTGVSDPYEAPDRPEVVVRTDRESVDESLARIQQALASRGLVAREAQVSA